MKWRPARRALAFSMLGGCSAILWLTGCGARSGLDLSEGTAGAVNAAVCESVTVAIDDLRPAVTLLVDQSGSMNFRYPDSTSPDTRWSLVRNALFDENHGVVKTFDSTVRFGIAFFTSHNGFSGGMCPILNEVHSATHNYEALRALYDQLRPDDDTPTGAALEKVGLELESASARGPQSVVLVTDGDADTCEQPDPQNGQSAALAATQRAYAAGIDVYVVGISNDIQGENLQQLANAGKGKPIDAVFGVDPNAAEPFQASLDLLGLTAQLAGILQQIPFCEVRLARDVDEGEASLGHVVLDGQPIPYDSANGYDLRDARHLEIVGAACETLKSKGKQLSVRIACD